MSEWEKFVVPDWVVKDRNRRLNSNSVGNCSNTESKFSIKKRQALHRGDMDEYMRLINEEYPERNDKIQSSPILKEVVFSVIFILTLSIIFFYLLV